jgi:precorrin-6Y C5,15-methyltransferase (decarboxylating)
LTVIIFAGTTEGRRISEYLGRAGVDVHVCVATGYGESLIERSASMGISAQRLSSDDMRLMFTEKKADLVIDATHPYAVAVSENITKACAGSVEYIRLLRPEGEADRDGIITVPDTDAAVEYLRGTEGRVLVATGSKELRKFTAIDGYRERLFARVLSLPDVVRQCADLGFEGKNLICMQGPFSEDLNYAMMRQLDIRYMVTKDSGGPGGFGEKVRAARRAGARTILIGRPPESGGMSYENVTELLASRYGIPAGTEDARKERPRTVSVIGAGMGYPDGMTVEALNACRSADLIIGPKRVAEAAGGGKDVFTEFRSDKVAQYIAEHPEHRDIAVVFSGDIGFHSGAKGLLAALGDGYDVRMYCGITSVQYLCSRLRIPWDDVFLMSSHGARANIIGEVRRRRKVFSLLSKGADVNELCGNMILYGMGDATVAVGENMGSDRERIISGTPAELAAGVFEGLCVALVSNENADGTYPVGIPDEAFIRGDAPMTKSEVRSLSVSKLKLSDDSVVYDIGAGTGSVAIEMSRVAVRGKVYAIEREESALGLIQRNKERFAADNLEIVHGKAPAALKKLPAPTHAFIGGSGGDLKKILKLLTEKNPDVRMVINSVTLETVGETVRCIKELGLREVETICVSVSRSRTTENVHLMMAQNPIYITVCEGIR